MNFCRVFIAILSISFHFIRLLSLSESVVAAEEGAEEAADGPAEGLAEGPAEGPADEVAEERAATGDAEVATAKDVKFEEMRVLSVAVSSSSDNF